MACTRLSYTMWGFLVVKCWSECVEHGKLSFWSSNIQLRNYLKQVFIFESTEFKIAGKSSVVRLTVKFGYVLEPVFTQIILISLK